MTGRRSARSSATRNQPSSPPQSANHARSLNPPRLRLTRSRSVDLGESNVVAKTKKGKQGSRQGSVDSARSDWSAVSSCNGRTRKASRGAVVNPELTMVAEEDLYSENEELVIPKRRPRDNKEPLEETAGNNNNNEPQISSFDPLSPALGSRMSGLTDLSDLTTHSELAVDELNPDIVEYLSELYNASYKILDLLAPNAVTSKIVESIVRELRVSESRRAVKLRFDENIFKILSERYLGTEDYIETRFILRKFLGRGNEDQEGDFRPDSIFYAANLAILIKEILVMAQESQNMRGLLTVLDTYFPDSFVNGFADTPIFGKSTLFDKSFALALEIRTQYAISMLVQGKEEEDWNPEKILENAFYDPPFDEGEAAELKGLMRNGPSNTQEQVRVIKDRINSIRSTFRQSEIAIEQRDLVDFERLQDELYPWQLFLEQIVSWTRSRADEIIECIDLQGGIVNIERLLVDIVKANNSQTSIRSGPSSTWNPPPLLPSASIRSGPKKSLHTKANAQKLASLKRKRLSTNDPELDQGGSLQTASKRSRLNQAGPSAASAQIRQDHLDDGNIDDDEQDNPSPSEEERFRASAMKSMRNLKKLQREKNKENLPEPNANKRRLNYQAPNAHRVEWNDDSQDNQPSDTVNDQQRAVTQDSDESEDQGYEIDQRVPNPSRRHAPALSPRSDSRHNQVANRERPRTETQDEDELLEASARDAVEGTDEDLEAEEDMPPPSTANVRVAARERTIRAKVVTQPGVQRRTPWSLADEQQLTRLIEAYGCKWSFIYDRGDWEEPRGQVALKDKARNLKVAWLKSGITLPANFEHVPLGKKEIASVRVVLPDYKE